MRAKIDTSLLDSPIGQAMHRRFTLTIAFVVVAIVVLISAGFATDYIGRNIGEDSTIRLKSELAETNGKLISDSLRRLLAESTFNGSGQAGDDLLLELSEGSEDPQNSLRLLVGGDQLDSLLSSINFHHMGFVDADGYHLWSVGSDDGLSPNSVAHESAISGGKASWLNRGVEISDQAGGVASVDLLETLIPLSSTGDSSPGLIFHYVVDVTETLEADIVATQAEIRRDVLIMLGILLAVLALFVLGLDMRISNRNRAVIANERSMRRELDAKNVDLQRLDEVKNEFLGRLSHELKTPLAAMLGFARILRNNRQRNLEPKQVEQLEIINRNGLRLDVLINDLLDLSRIQGEGIELVSEETEITGVIESVLKSFETTLKARGQSLVLNIDHGQAWLDIDRIRIVQVLNNLITNASKYSPKGSAISVSSVRDRDSLVISISDDGDGISADDQRHLFTLFYRTPDAHDSAVPGTGIGLYVSKQIIDLHGGEISLSSAPGKGTKVAVRLFGVKDQSSRTLHHEPFFTNTLQELDDVV